MEPHEAHRGSQNTSAQRGKVTGKDRSATGCNQENAKPGESILQDPQCRLYYRLVSKTADPTAEVSGPVVDYWWNYFYSKKDIESGWASGPCISPWSNPKDRIAHGGIPFIEYYLQQFKSAQATYGPRLLDYLELHTYFAAQYPAGSGNSVGFTAAGDTGEQQARLNSTRVFWDPTYTDSN